MSYDLSFILRQAAALQGRRRRRFSKKAVIIRPAQVTTALVAELYSIINRMVSYWEREVDLRLLHTYDAALRERAALTRDAGADDLATEIGNASEGAARLAIELGPLLRSWVVHVETWHRNRWVSKVRESAGYDIGALVADLSAQPEVVAYQQWASGLIRDVSQTMRRKIEAEVFAAVANQTPRRKVAKEIAAIMKTTRKRALLISRDQANKVSGKMDELRQREAGINQYRWRTAGDERVRPTHAANEGKIFSWKRAPAVTGHPKTEINCRCIAEAYIPLLAEVEADVGR